VVRSAQAIGWHSRSPAETRALARGLAAALAPEAEGIVVSLIGPLGAGKTEFAKGVAEGFGLPAAALASPTFTIAQELPLPAPGAGPRRLVHADCYRLESAEELEAAGLFDWLGAGTVLLAEWGDRFPEALGPARLEVFLAEAPDGARELAVAARGAGPERVLARWRERCP
jgi:tRNA threonylcarbamoyladenosine biosynthesis protein TsaE